MTLQELVEKYPVRIVAGVPGQDRWVEIETDEPSPGLFGAFWKADDYSLCGYRCDGKVLNFQRNAKPVEVTA